MDEEVSFEALLELRNQVGLKSFKKFESAVLFKNKNAKSENPAIKKETKKQSKDDQPLEMSSKLKRQRPQQTESKRKQRTRDPRFDHRIGKFSEDKFRKNYEFAFKMRDEEVDKLKESMQDERQTAKKKYLIQRMENQKREKFKKRNSNKKVEILADGSKFYKTKKLQRTEELINKFEELKKAGKLEKHLDKRRKKQAGKERKKMNIEK